MEDKPTTSQNVPTPDIRFLKALCILTFIGSGMGVFSYGVISIAPDIFAQNIDTFPDAQSREFLKLILSSGRTFFLLNATLYGLSLTGAILMWKMRKVGFHFYTISQLLLLIFPLLYIKGFPMPGFTIFLTLIFIWGYGTFLKQMK